jgi:hypothetical protein
MVIQATTKANEKTKPKIRRPTQERGKQRYEDILNAVEVLLPDRDRQMSASMIFLALSALRRKAFITFSLRFRSSLWRLPSAIWRRFAPWKLPSSVISSHGRIC